MHNALFHNKKGVSEVIASLILMLIVSVAGVIVYSYSLGTFNSSSSFLQSQTSNEEERTQERFSIIAVWWSTSNQLNLTVLNYGRIEVAIDAVYVNGTAVSAFLSGKGITVGAGQLVWVKFTSPFSILSGNVHEILAVSERGGKNAVFWKA
jgi:FlaG/FlaF family flagellin (archaellin)